MQSFFNWRVVYSVSCAEDENCSDENINGNVEYSGCCIDITALISPLNRLARGYCTHLEVKFDAFIRLKRGKETIIAIFPQFHTRTALTFDQANKNNSVIYRLKANNTTAYWQTTNNILTSLTNQVNNLRHIYHLLTFHNSLDSEDNFRSGCGNVSQSHPKQSFSGLHSPRWS